MARWAEAGQNGKCHRFVRTIAAHPHPMLPHVMIEDMAMSDCGLLERPVKLKEPGKYRSYCKKCLKKNNAETTLISRESESEKVS